MAIICSEQLRSQESGLGFDSFGVESKNEAAPFVHRFKTENENYIYDVNTLRILKVSQVVWDVIEDVGRLTNEQMLDKYCPPYSRDEIQSALTKIDQTRKNEGLLLSNRPNEILPPREEMIKTKLDHHREQLILNVTEKCNFRCSYCLFGDEFAGYRNHSKRDMSLEVAQKAMHDFFQHSKDTKDRVISFYGGEPLLNIKLIRQCVEYVKQRIGDSHVQFSMTTNGSLIRGETAKFLADEDFLLLVSLDGPRELHDSQRRFHTGDCTWEIIIRNLESFLIAYPQYRSNGRLRFNAVASESMDLCDCQSFWSQMELFSNSMGLMISSQKEEGNKTDILSQDTPLSRSLKNLYDLFVRNMKTGYFTKEYKKISTWVQSAVFEQPYVMFHKRGRLSPHLPKTMRFLNHCIPGVRRTFVNVNGDYFPCERVPTCKAQCIGNIHKGIELEKVMAMIQRWVAAGNEQCRYCWCLPTCAMGCLATLGNETGFSPEAKSKACSFHRRHMHRVITDYCRILEENPKAFDYANDIEIV